MHSIRMSLAAAVVFAVAASSCSNDGAATSPAAPGAPRTLALIGDSPVATVASAVSVSAKVVDSIGLTIPNIVVNFVVTSGGGSVFAPAVTTSSLGVANQQWTLGTKAGKQTVEVHWIDPANGNPRVLGVITATAQPGPIVLLHARDTTVYTGTTFAITPSLVTAVDAYNNPVTGISLTITNAGGLPVSGINVTVPATESATTVQLAAGSATASMTVRSVLDLRKYAFAAQWACTYTRPFQYTGTDVDSTLSAMSVDSIRDAKDPGPREGLGYGTWGAYIAYAHGSTTHYLHNAAPVTLPDHRSFAIMSQWPDSLQVAFVTMFGTSPADGSLPSGPVPDGITTYEGHLTRAAGATFSYSGALIAGCMGQYPYPLHPMVLFAK